MSIAQDNLKQVDFYLNFFPKNLGVYVKKNSKSIRNFFLKNSPFITDINDINDKKQELNIIILGVGAGYFEIPLLYWILNNYKDLSINITAIDKSERYKEIFLAAFEKILDHSDFGRDDYKKLNKNCNGSTDKEELNKNENKIKLEFKVADIEKDYKINEEYEEYEEYDVTNKFFSEKKYDIAICSFVLNHISFWRSLIIDIRNALKDGGSIFITQIGGDSLLLNGDINKWKYEFYKSGAGRTYPKELIDFFSQFYPINFSILSDNHEISATNISLAIDFCEKVGFINKSNLELELDSFFTSKKNILNAIKNKLYSSFTENIKFHKKYNGKDIIKNLLLDKKDEEFEFEFNAKVKWYSFNKKGKDESYSEVFRVKHDNIRKHLELFNEQIQLLKFQRIPIFETIPENLDNLKNYMSYRLHIVSNIFRRYRILFDTIKVANLTFINPFFAFDKSKFFNGNTLFFANNKLTKKNREIFVGKAKKYFEELKKAKENGFIKANFTNLGFFYNNLSNVISSKFIIKFEINLEKSSILELHLDDNISQIVLNYNPNNKIKNKDISEFISNTIELAKVNDYLPSINKSMEITHDIFGEGFIYFFPMVIHVEEEIKKQFINLTIITIEELNYNEIIFYNKIINKLGDITNYKNAIRFYHSKSRLLKQQLKTANISILVDSFAHNISAHSLSSIVWLYMQKNSILDKRFYIESGSKLQKNLIEIPMENNVREISAKATKNYDDLGYKDSTYNEDYFSINDILNYLNNPAFEKLFSFLQLRTDKTNPKLKDIPKFGIPLDSEMVHFLKYLKEKSTFWNGVSRDIMYGGETKNWYEVIYEFSNNPLFLGTIAHSEGINKVDINLGFDFVDNDKQKLLDFMTIDISNLMQNNLTLEPKNYIVLGKEYKKIRKVLSKYSVFLPGGFVGKHSLYTIFENTMRNIKHSKEREKIIFNIFIKLKDDKKIYDLTIWLSNETDLKDKDVQSIKKITLESIMTDNGKPKLGGTSQDKICASMLFTNKFSDVENKNITYNNKRKYPWIKFPELDKKEKVKRQFSLWKGEDYIKLRNGRDLNNENISRFIFSIVFKDSKVSPKVISENGIIRKMDFEKIKEFSDNGSLINLIKEKKSYEIELEEKKQIKDLLYQKWNNDWIKFDGKIGIGVSDNSGKYLKFIISKNNTWTISEVDPENNGINENRKTIYFAHGETSETNTGQILQYRNHGPLIEKFLNISDGEIIGKSNEFIESLLTKVLIIDNRVYDRISSYSKIELFENSLFLTVKNEKDKNIENLKKDINEGNYNFVILHLSYIESIKGYSETNVDRFVEYLFGEKGLSKNTKFIITTGRGRDLWREKVEEKDYYEHIMLKPIDMLLDSIQDGLIFKDDFMVKYNLLKSIFGS